MLTVEVYHLRDGRDALAGTITLDGERLHLEPSDSTLLNNLAADLGEGEDPAEFLHGLHRVYNGSYLRCTPAEEQ